MFINLQVAPLELRFRASDSGTFEPVDFPRHADSRFVAGEHGRTKPVTIHIITSRLNRFDDSLVLLIEGPRLPGAHAVIDLRIVLTKISRRAIRTQEHTSELPSLHRISYAVLCLKTQTIKHN